MGAIWHHALCGCEVRRAGWEELRLLLGTMVCKYADSSRAMMVQGGWGRSGCPAVSMMIGLVIQLYAVELRDVGSMSLTPT